MRHRRIPFAVLSVLLAAGVALGACGDDDGADVDVGASVEDGGGEVDGEAGASVTERSIRAGLEAVDIEVEEVSVDDGEARVELSGDVDVPVVCTAVGAFAERVVVAVDGEETEC